MTQTNLYYKTQLKEKVSLLPNQIDNNIDDHILENLKLKIEGKSTDNGIIINIMDLIGYPNGKIDRTNFTGSTCYEVTYRCILCSPTVDLEIVCIVDNITTEGYIICRNGPVIAVIQINTIDTNIYKIDRTTVTHIKSKEKIVIGSYLRVSIININNNTGERQIVSMCKILGIASKEDIKKYKEDQKLANNEKVEEEEFI